jgi:Fe-S cluster assembly ATP-binding protein
VQGKQKDLYMRVILEQIKPQNLILSGECIFGGVYKEMSLSVSQLSVSVAGKDILDKVSITIQNGKLHVLMGPNGSGKSTLAAALMASPSYIITDPKYLLKLDNTDITKFPTEKRATSGLFLGFQNPISVPGVSVANLLKTAVSAKKDIKKTEKRTQNPFLSVWDFNKKLIAEGQKLGIQKELLGRGINEDFSGGEKKKIEMLQAIIIKPKYAIFDEIDTGLDVDALKTVAGGLTTLIKNGTGVLLITHYQRILKYVKPDKVHILVKGKIVEEGNFNLVKAIEKDGYKKWLQTQN